VGPSTRAGCLGRSFPGRYYAVRLPSYARNYDIDDITERPGRGGLRDNEPRHHPGSACVPIRSGRGGDLNMAEYGAVTPEAVTI
jgi:hypothetical protein